MKFIRKYLKETASLINLLDKKKIFDIVIAILKTRKKKEEFFLSVLVVALLMRPMPLMILERFAILNVIAPLTMCQN